MKFKRIPRILLGIIMLSTVAFSMQLFVPIDDPVYDFLERQATRGYISEFMNDVKPLQRDEIVQWLLVMKDLEAGLHRTDRALLTNFLAEYRVEISNDTHPDLHDGQSSRLGIGSWNNFKNDMHSLFNDDPRLEEKHMYLLENDKTIFWLNTDFTVTGEGKNSTLRFVDRLGAEASAQLGDHLAFFVDGYFFHYYLPDMWREISDEYLGYWINDHEFSHLATFDRSEAYINYTGDFGTFSIAHYPVVWGNSLHSIILSDKAIPFGSLRWTKTFNHFKYSFLHGSLMTNNFTWTEAEGRYYMPKYLVGHNLEIEFTPRFHATFTEMLVYGNRIPEPTYMLPVIFLWPSEHTLGDRDNKMIKLGAEIFPINGLRVYGNALLDELVFGQIFKDFWANKFALQAGLQWSPRSLPMDVNMEFTAVHPWTYAHKYEFTTYTHHGQDLGFFMGPNSQLFTTKINYDLSSKDKISLEYNHAIEGADSVLVDGILYPVGGDSNQDYQKRSHDINYTTTWLMGDLEIKNSLKLEWLHRWRNQIELLTACELRQIDGQLDAYYSFRIHVRY